MNRSIAIACLVGAIFAMGTLAARGSAEPIADIAKAEQEELAQDSEYLLTTAKEIYAHDNRYGGTDGKELLWVPVMKHLLRSIERTRSQIIGEALEKSKGSATIKQDLIEAHYRAYQAINGDFVEFAKAANNVKEFNSYPQKIEKLVFEGIERVEAYKV